MLAAFLAWLQVFLHGAAVSAAMTAAPCDHPAFNNQYDKHIRSSVEQYWPMHMRPYWCRFKAQLLAESGAQLDATAVSSADAHGIAQIVSATQAEIERKLGVTGDIYDAKYGITLGAFYMRNMLDFWIFERPPDCKLTLAEASYNAGAGSIQRAQGLSGGQLCWPEIHPYLHHVTGRHSKETVTYIGRIKDYHTMLQSGAGVQ